MSAMHIIRFPNNKAHERGLSVLLDTLIQSLGLPNRHFVVLDEHIRALEEAKVPFTYASKTQKNGKQGKPVQS